jgi:hypothetical protein
MPAVGGDRAASELVAARGGRNGNNIRLFDVAHRADWSRATTTCRFMPSHDTDNRNFLARPSIMTRQSRFAMARDRDYSGVHAI